MNGPPAALQVRCEHGIAVVTLDRPEALNAISTTMARELCDTARALAADESVWAVVLASSSPRAFSAGADLKERSRMSTSELLEQRPLFRSAFAALADLPQPSIAAVAGLALGGGLELALCCDVVVADETAELGLPEVRVGLVPGGGGTQRLPRRVGIGKASELVLSGRRVAAAEALSIGLVDRLVPPGAAEQVALELAALIAANSPVATRAAKRAIRLGSWTPLEDGLELEDLAWREAATSPDRVEGIAAFAERRPPRWGERGEEQR